MELATPQIYYQLSGTIKHMGLPVAGVELRIFKENDETSGICRELQLTGPKGEYSFALEAGSYALQMVPPSTTRFVGQTVSNIAIKSNAKQDFTLNTGMTVSGSIQCQTAVDLTQFEIVATDTSAPNNKLSTILDASGRFEFTLARGEYELLVVPRATGRLNSLHFAREILQVNRDLRCQITLPSLVSFTGRVTDSDNNPLPGVEVEISPTDVGKGKIQSRVISDNDGSCTVDVTPGAYELLLRPSTDSDLTAVLHNVEVKDADTHTIVMAEGKTLHGLIAYNNEAVINCRVKIRSLTDSLETVAVTDSQGQFSIKLPDSTYEVTVESLLDPLKKGSEKSTAPWSRGLTIDNDTDLIIELQDGYGVRFDVSDDNDRPLANCQITWGPYNQEAEVLGKLLHDRKPEILCGTATTDESGACQLFLPSGVYFFQLKAADGNTYAEKHIRQLSISTHTRRKVKMQSPAADTNVVTQLLIDATQTAI